MKKMLSLTFICFFGLTVFSYGQRDSSSHKQQLSPAQLQQRQQLFEKKQDSAICNRTIVRMKELFALTPQQEQDLFRAGLTINKNRRGVFKSYWKTDAFRVQMAGVDSAADSLYASIVGGNNYQVYKDALHSRLVQRQQVMQKRAGVPSTDTIHIKQ